MPTAGLLSLMQALDVAPALTSTAHTRLRQGCVRRVQGGMASAA